MTAQPHDVTTAPDTLQTANGAARRRWTRDDRILRLAFLVSATGDWVFRFALPLIVLDLTGSAVSTALVFAVEFAPYIVVGLFAGVVADRVDRRRLMITCDMVSAVVVGAVAVLCMMDRPPVLALYALAFALASVRPFHFPAFQGFIVDRVAATRRPTVNAWVQGTDSALSLIGPAIGVAVVTVLGPVVASYANAASFVVSAALLTLTTATMITGQRARALATARSILHRVWPDLVEGLQVLVRITPLLWGTILMTVTNVATPAVEANLVFLLAGADGEGAPALGVVFALQGAGSLLGAAAAPRLMRHVAVGHLLCAGMVALAIALLIPALGPTTVTIAVAWTISGIAMSLIVVPWFTYRQSIVDAAVTGRVVAVSRAIAFASIPFGAIAGGWVLVEFGPVWLFLIAGVVQCVAGAGCLVSPLRRADSSTTSDADET